MYTVTVKISDRGIDLLKEEGTSATGHMWYSLSDGNTTTSYGFAPKVHGHALGEGKVYDDDDKNYASNYYTGEIVITKDQYDKLIAFGNKDNLDGHKFDFSSYYNGASNSCIDYTWKALNIIDLNPNDFEGQSWPIHNADNADKTLYKHLFGNTDNWDESLPDAGNYDVLYGSTKDNSLVNDGTKEAIYGGGGNDSIYGRGSNDKIYGGIGNDILDGNDGNDVLDGGAGEDILKGGEGYDTYKDEDKATITDSDGKGTIHYKGKTLDGEKELIEEGIYKDENFTYFFEGTGDLKIQEGIDNNTLGSTYITIKNFKSGNLNIELKDSEQNLTNTQGIIDLEDLSKELVARFETNQEVRINNIEQAFNNVNNQETRDLKILALANTNLASNLDNIYSKQYIEQYQDQVISNQGNLLSYTDILNIEIKPNFDFNNFNSLTKNDYIYEPYSSNNSKSNSNIQTIE